MLAIVEAEMSTRPRAPRCRRSADSGDFVSVNGTRAASLMCSHQHGDRHDEQHRQLEGEEEAGQLVDTATPRNIMYMAPAVKTAEKMIQGMFVPV